MSSLYNEKMDDKEYIKRLGIKLQMLRKFNGVSQDDLVNSLYIDKSYYSRLERGISNPSLTYLKHIAEYFNIELSELLNVQQIM